MAQFEPKKLNIGEINGGNRFNNGDGVGAEAINAPIEAALYAEEIAQEAIGVKEQVQDHEERIAKTEYDTKMLYAIASQKGLYAVAEVEQAYTSRVTANGENIVDGQKTPVTLIKGSTVRCENLIPFPYKGNVKNVGDTFVINGLTYKVNDDGSITVNGTSTARSDCNLFPMDDSFTIPIGTYTITGCPQGVTQSVGQFQFVVKYADGTTNDTFLGANQLKTIEITQEVVGVYVNIVTLSGQTMNNITFKPMLNVGSTALPWQPYFTDLKRAKIDSIVSTGRNLFDKSKTKDGYEILSTTADKVNPEWFVTNLIPALPNTKYVVSGKPTGTAVISYDINQNPNGNLGGGADGVFTTGADVYFIKLNGLLTEKDTFQLEVGSTATDYTPFIQETYQLPETLELGEWDSFNTQTGEITRATSKQLILTGEESWEARGTNGTIEGDFRRNFIRLSSIAPTTVREVQAVSNLYNGVTAEDTYNRITGVSASSNILDIYDPVYATDDVTLWKQHLKDLYAAGTPLIVEYKLATPTVEKIENVPKSYTAYNQGNETAVLENEEFGAIPTITNEYIVVL